MTLATLSRALEVTLKNIKKFGNSHLGAEGTNLKSLVIVKLAPSFIYFFHLLWK